MSSATDLRPFFYQCHRDTRLNELVGESVIVRSNDTDGREIIKQDVVHGGILTCELAVLDDISRNARGLEGAPARPADAPAAPVLSADFDGARLRWTVLTGAPGEALNVLLRVLNERRWGGGPRLPLMTAIATGNPVQEDGFYGEVRAYYL